MSKFESNQHCSKGDKLPPDFLGNAAYLLLADKMALGPELLEAAGLGAGEFQRRMSRIGVQPRTHGVLMALATLIFLSLHVVTAVVDPFTALGWNAALVPFSSSYRRFWLGLGVVAIYLLLAIVLTSLLRPIFGHRAWRTVHWLSYAMWPVAVIHGIGTGTDPWFAWMLAIEALCIGGVVAAVAWRVGRVAPTAWRQIPTASPRAQKWS